MLSHFRIYLLISCLALTVACTEPIVITDEPRHFIVSDDDAEMSIDLSWKVNEHTDGYNFINLDLYFSDTSRLTKDAFLLGARYPMEGSWRNQPVLLFSVVERNHTEMILHSRYEHGLGDFRKYLGIAVNGKGEKFSELSGDVIIDYQINIKLEEKTETFTGSIAYSTAWQNKTAVKYIASCDIEGLYNHYSFRELTQPVWVVRNSDFTFTRELNVSSSGWRTQENDRLVVELDWSVNNTCPGFDHVDLDLYSGTFLPGNPTNGSENENYYEQILYKTYNVNDYQREVGHTFFKNLKPGNPASITIQYTYKVYFQDNPFERYVLASSFQSPPTSAPTTIYKALAFTKSGNTVSVTP